MIRTTFPDLAQHLSFTLPYLDWLSTILSQRRRSVGNVKASIAKLTKPSPTLQFIYGMIRACLEIQTRGFKSLVVCFLAGRLIDFAFDELAKSWHSSRVRSLSIDTLYISVPVFQSKSSTCSLGSSAAWGGASGPRF